MKKGIYRLDSIRKLTLLSAYEEFMDNEEDDVIERNTFFEKYLRHVPKRLVFFAIDKLVESGDIGLKVDSRGLTVYLIKISERGLQTIENEIEQDNSEFLKIMNMASSSRSMFGKIYPGDLEQGLSAGLDAQTLDGIGNLNEVPAADRLVSLNDNGGPLQTAAISAADALEKLSEALEGSNDLFANRDERLVVAREIRGLGDALRVGLVRLGSLVDATRSSGVLRWLISHSVGGVIGNLATDGLKLCVELIKLIGS